MNTYEKEKVELKKVQSGIVDEKETMITELRKKIREGDKAFVDLSKKVSNE